MIWTLLALVSMVALGGFISYYGDLQGRRWGKKRVSWFGLRPKHTAILITSLTGAFIAFFSVATVLLIAPPVRRIVLSGERAIRENKDLNAQYERKTRDYENTLREKSVQAASAQAKYDALNLDLSQATKELSEAQREIADSRKQQNTLLEKNKNLQVSFFKTERDLKQRLFQIAAMETKSAALTRKQTLLTRNLRGLQKTISDQTYVNNSVGKQNEDLIRQRTALETNKKTLEDKNAALTKLQGDLQKESARMERANQVLLDTNKRLLADNEETIQKNEAKARQLQTTIQELTQRQEELLGLLQKNDGAADQYAALRQQPITLRSSEMLARRRLDAHTGSAAARRELQELVSDACAVALLRGAGRGENGRTAMLFNRRNVALAGSQAADERAVLDALADKLSGAKGPILLMAKTLTNTVEGEQALLALDFAPIVPTFAKGELVAQSGPIESGKPVRDIVDAIVQFLQNDVRDAALKRGAVPQIDPQTGAKQVGSFSPADLVELTEKVRRMGGKIEIRAVAAQSLHSADPLRLDFQLTRPQKDL